MDLLACQTQADIAASDVITGSNNIGGDWDLEVKSGTIESTAIVVNEYNHSLV
ncbi:DUF4347 domain-containing protein [Aliarcobacter butzleri]|uniref:DUF4347 domain-containing protein n=1 Tax=Aliarcobacter butzleri TaxID=28197 RepID=UPI003ADDC70C